MAACAETQIPESAKVDSKFLFISDPTLLTFRRTSMGGIVTNCSGEAKHIGLHTLIWMAHMFIEHV